LHAGLRKTIARLSVVAVSLQKKRLAWHAGWSGFGVAAAASIVALLSNGTVDSILPKLEPLLTTAATQHNHDTSETTSTVHNATVTHRNVPPMVEVALDPKQSSGGEASPPLQIGMDRSSGDLAETRMAPSELTNENTGASEGKTSSGLKEASGESRVGGLAGEQQLAGDFVSSATATATATAPGSGDGEGQAAAQPQALPPSEAIPGVPGMAKPEDMAARSVAVPPLTEPASPTPQPSAAPEQRIAESDDSPSSAPDQPVVLPAMPVEPRGTHAPRVALEESTDDPIATMTALNEHPPPTDGDRAQVEPEPSRPSSITATALPSEPITRVQEKPVERMVGSNAPAEQPGPVKAGRTHNTTHSAKNTVHALKAARNKSGEARLTALPAPGDGKAAAPPVSQDGAMQPPLQAPVALAMASPPLLAPQRVDGPQCVSYRSNM